ncbi:hypothetical protein METHB2_740019 [Candidatus Methylobacter favarea]|uniref:Helicase/UvrB N-terminal domain-containing protein n=1 Tax=Candidatus Methylobacter favarea TaxID=2707345 RepID=A0A8S0X9R7_9GAMM|nr:DEAD/DEAH box helicase family protein [Candidatus Methylobacter favarea]CAA9892596.1 hypothetical protein METHB2_740019 [Candidatus Methylobacter favarea]
MRKILEHYCLSEHSNGLLLLSMPTGFGKTYNVLNFIYEHYQEFSAQGRKILFITNLKKNLPISELRNRFEKDGKINEFEKNVLFIDSNADSIVKNLVSVDSEIPDSFKTSKYSRLKSYIETLNQKNQLPAVKDIFASEIKRELEPAFRKFVTEVLYKEFKTKSARLSEIKNNRDFQWIGKLYPAVFTDERTVLFLSMDKFFVKNTTLIEQSYYFHEHLIRIL